MTDTSTDRVLALADALNRLYPDNVGLRDTAELLRALVEERDSARRDADQYAKLSVKNRETR